MINNNAESKTNIVPDVETPQTSDLCVTIDNEAGKPITTEMVRLNSDKVMQLTRTNVVKRDSSVLNKTIDHQPITSYDVQENKDTDTTNQLKEIPINLEDLWSGDTNASNQAIKTFGSPKEGENGVPKNFSFSFFPTPYSNDPPKDQWVKLVAAQCFPGFCAFCWSIIQRLNHGEWWAIAYNLGYEDGQLKLPSILRMHIHLAVIMLGLLITQVLLAYYNRFNWHKILGYLVIFIVLSSLIPGILGLAFCDTTPKQGIEVIFFVAIGICIVVSFVKAVVAIQNKDHFHHKQYIVWAMALTFSPGWNRLCMIVWRHLINVEPFCFMVLTFTHSGVHYTPSFLIGLSYTGIVWVYIMKMPFFKRGSSGYWQAVFLLMVLFLCIYQSIMTAPELNWTQNTCSTQQINEYKEFTNGGLVSKERYVGLCHAGVVGDAGPFFVSESN